MGIRHLDDLSPMLFQIIQAVEGLEEGSDEVVFVLGNGSKVRLFHEQDCCEDVRLEDFDGDESDLVGGIVLVAEEVSGETHDPLPGSDVSYTWTFYKIQTSKGCITLRWYGESNGCYSESVDVEIEER